MSLSRVQRWRVIANRVCVKGGQVFIFLRQKVIPVEKMTGDLSVLMAQWLCYQITSSFLSS